MKIKNPGKILKIYCVRKNTFSHSVFSLQEQKLIFLPLEKVPIEHHTHLLPLLQCCRHLLGYPGEDDGLALLHGGPEDVRDGGHQQAPHLDAAEVERLEDASRRLL